MHKVLGDPELRPHISEDALRSFRLKALNTPKNDDYIEHQIWNYGQQNVQWCRLWADVVGYGPFAETPAFRVVEEHMGDPAHPRAHERWLKLVSHIAWEDDTGIGIRTDIPFWEQAKAFKVFYDKTNLLYGNHVLER